MYKEANLTAELLKELPSGELLVAAGEPALKVAGGDGGEPWLWVQSPTEETVEIMSEKPLEYEEGWIHVPDAGLEVATHQLGDRLTGRVDVPDHPVTNLVKQLPFFQGPLPDWIPHSVCELHDGKVGGVLKGGRFLLQRPSGAVPERLVLEGNLLLTRKERRKHTAWAATLGVAFAGLVGLGFHTREYLRGTTEVSRKTWPQLGVWLLYAPVLITPATALPCYGLSNSPGSTFCVVAAINLLFYSDLFSE